MPPVTVSSQIDTSYVLVWISGKKTLNDNLYTLVINSRTGIGGVPDIDGTVGTEMFYKQNENGLYIYAYSNIGTEEGAMPKRPQTYQFKFNNNHCCPK